MREMTIKDIQQVSLEILKDVHSFCVSNNIRYTLYGGTMIGAIRHKGFIPWDDDVDIAMPRPDYERFLSLYHSQHGYKLFASGSEESYLAFSRVCEMRRTFVINSQMPWANAPTGVWIDIFPLDGAPDTTEECENRLKVLKKLWKRSCYARSAKSTFSFAKGAIEKAKMLIKKTIYNDYIITPQKVILKYTKEATLYEWGQTNYFWNCSYLRYGMKEYQDICDFQSTILVPFENDMFCVCNGYDHLMRTKYGDYMEMPPIEKQKSNHALCSYYWK